MPIYDYVCGSCGHRFEVFRGINKAGPHQCPECGGPVARAFAPPTIHFKGSGWAKSDRRATSGPARRSDSGATTPATAGTASSGDGVKSAPATSNSTAGSTASSSGDGPKPATSTHADGER